MVKRERCPHDRRQHLCWITADGRRCCTKLDGAVLEAAEACMTKLSARERLALIRLLEAVRAE